MLSPQVTIPQWLQIPRELRGRIVEIFKIPRSGGTVVIDNVVTTDGYTHEDLSLLSLPVLQEYLQEPGESDLFALMNLLIMKLQDEQEKILKEQEETKEKLKADEVEAYKAQIVDTVKNLTDISQTVIKRHEQASKTK
jgi:hypothetical protein